MPQDKHRRIAIGQLDSVRGDVAENLRLMTEQARQAADEGAALIVFPELALTGYLADRSFADAARLLESQAIQELAQVSQTIDVCFGFIEETHSALFYNSAAYLTGGRIKHVHRKIYPPTYGDFDERRYFGAGWDISAFDTQIARSAILVCGDAWHLPLAYLAAHDGADVLYILAASSVEGLTSTTPCNEAWQWMCRSYALTLSCFVVFANLAGNGDGIRFWGGSFVVGPDGNLVAQSSSCDRDLLLADLDLAALRQQRIKLPFRRDDSLAHTVSLGQRILDSKILRDAFHHSSAIQEAAAPKPR